MTQQDFYMVLPSNSSMNFFPDNTLTHFRTRLPRRYTLDGQWEVGLAEVQYPRNWYQITKATCWYKVKLGPDEEMHALKFRQAYYQDYVDIRQEFQRGLERIPGGSADRVRITYSRVEKVVTVQLRDEGAVFQMSPCLQRILGFDTPELLGPGRYTSNTTLDMDQGFYNLYVYCDLLDNRVVGDILAPLLRVVSVRGSVGDHVCQSFDNVEYVPLRKKDFQELEVDIRTDFGEPVAFERGKVVVTLHFRRVAPQFW